MRAAFHIVFLLACCLVAGCQQDARPVVRPGAPLDLGLDSFLRTDAEDLVEIPDRVEEELVDLEEEEIIIVEGEPCSVLGQDCQQGLRCTLGQGGGGICVLIGPRTEGQACGDPIDNCAEDLICLRLATGEEPAGFRCYRLCDTDTSTGCSLDQTCEDLIEWAQEPVGICR